MSSRQTGFLISSLRAFCNDKGINWPRALAAGGYIPSLAPHFSRSAGINAVSPLDILVSKMLKSRLRKANRVQDLAPNRVFQKNTPCRRVSTYGGDFEDDRDLRTWILRLGTVSADALTKRPTFASGRGQSRFMRNCEP